MEGLQFLQSVLGPMIAISNGPYVEKIIKKNNLESFLQFIRPFGGRITKISTADALGNPLTLSHSVLRFCQAENFGIPFFDQKSENKDCSESLPHLKTQKEAKEWRENSSFETLTPWFYQYRAMVLKQIGASEHETFNHPIARLIVVSSANPDAAGTVKALIAKGFPPIFSKGFIDPNVLNLVLYIHDSEESLHIDQSAVTQIKQLYETHVITINTFLPSESGKPVVPDIWAEFLDAENDSSNTSKPLIVLDLPGVVPAVSDNNKVKDIRGLRLSQTDFAEIDSFMSGFLAQKVYALIASRMKEWERDVASTRRGISGRLFKVGLKYFGSSKQAPMAPGSFMDTETNTTMFPFGSPEMIMRRLGDYAMMIKEYKYAHAIYESVKKDFTVSEKYSKFYAGVQEMLSLTTILLSEGNKNNYEVLYDAAVQSYSNSKANIFAVRTTILVSEAIKEHQAYREAAFSYLRVANGEDDLKCGMLLEQAGVCFLRGSAPLHRKYAFNLFLSARRFLNCGMPERAKQNYSSALAIYGDLGWTIISDQLNFALGKQAIQRNEYEIAVNHFMKLLHKSNQTPSTHRAFLAEFLFLFQQFAAMANPESVQEKMAAIPIPILFEKTTRLHTKNPKANGNPLDPVEEGVIWASMEAEVLQTLSITSFGVANVSGLRVESVVTEPVYVSFEWKNPLQVPIPVNNVHLECAFGDDAPSFSQIVPTDGGILPSIIEHPHFNLEILSDAALDFNEKRRIILKLYPLKEGIVKIVGIRYLLCGIIPCYMAFTAQGEIRVSPPVPVLEVKLHNVPKNILTGQVTSVSLEVNNKGGKGLKGLFLKSSLPSFCYFGDGTSPVHPEYIKFDTSGKTKLEQTVLISNKIEKYDITHLKLPAGESSDSESFLGPGMTTLVPMFLRPDTPGQHNLRFLFVYQSVEAKSAVYRTLRVSLSVNVSPSIRVSAFSKSSLNNLDEFIIGLEVANLRSSTDIFFRQLTSVSPFWSVSRIDESDEISCKLAPNEIRYFYLKAKRSKAPIALLSPEFNTTLAVERLILGEDNQTSPNTNIQVLLTGLASQSNMSDNTTAPFQSLLAMGRNIARYEALRQQYPTFSREQISELFAAYWSDDLDFVFFYHCPSTNADGHMTITGSNLSLEPALPLASWLSGVDSKILAGRALFERTFQERKELIKSLVQSKMSESSPVRVLLTHPSSASLKDGRLLLPVLVKIGNTSWMNEAVYDLEMVNNSVILLIEKFQRIFSWEGLCKFTGSLKPLETREFRVNAICTAPGVYNVNRWKLSCSLVFPKTLIEASAASKLERIGNTFLQQPTFPLPVSIND